MPPGGLIRACVGDIVFTDQRKSAIIAGKAAGKTPLDLLDAQLKYAVRCVTDALQNEKKVWTALAFHLRVVHWVCTCVVCLSV